MMYSDGMIGNRALIENQVMTNCAIFNYMRDAKQPPYSFEQLLGPAHDYFFPVLSAEEHQLKLQTQLRDFVAHFAG